MSEKDTQHDLDFKALMAARDFIRANVCDPDITQEMCEKWKEYQEAMREAGRSL